jgi:hypothetical protein
MYAAAAAGVVLGGAALYKGTKETARGISKKVGNVQRDRAHNKKMKDLKKEQNKKKKEREEKVKALTEKVRS